MKKAQKIITKRKIKSFKIKSKETEKKILKKCQKSVDKGKTVW